MLNLFTDDVRRNPFPLYDHFRTACPVMLEPTSGVWMIFDYAGVKRVLDDPETFASDTAGVARTRGARRGWCLPIRRDIRSCEPSSPRHSRPGWSKPGAAHPRAVA